jgi:C1A family cysteine protease
LIFAEPKIFKRANMKPRKPQNAVNKIAKTVKGKRQTQPSQPQTQSAKERTRSTAKKYLKEEVIFPKDNPRKIRAEAKDRTQAYRQFVKAKLAASKRQLFISGDYLGWIRERIQKANPDIRVPPTSARALAPFLSRFDWRLSGIVSLIRNQNEPDCSACWAFAAAAAYESSLRRNQDRYQSVAAPRAKKDLVVYFADVHIAVQDVLDAVSKRKCEAGWPGDAFDHFVKKGIQVTQVFNFGQLSDLEAASESVEFDIGLRDSIGKKKRRLKKQERNTVKAIAWDYVQADPRKIPSPKQMKEALLDHGPLVVLVNLDDAFKSYPEKGEVFTNTNSHSVNHVVLLTGWDDAKDAWIIQNSFGSEWGISCLTGQDEQRADSGMGLENVWMSGTIINMKNQRGCMYIKRRANHIGQFAMWIEAPFKLS